MDIEHLLRTTLDDQATEAPRAREGIFEEALAAQRNRRRQVAGMAAAVVAVGADRLGHDPVGGNAAAPTTAATATDSQMTVAEQQASFATYLKITDPPQVPVIRLVTNEERQVLLDACLDQSGWDTKAGFPVDQKAAYDLANYICMASYPVYPELTGTWTDKQTAIQYDWTVNTELPCLAALGHTVTTPAPTRDEFITTWDTNPYFPFAYIEGSSSLTNQERELLEAQCPQNPPSDQLWD
jgi:hypothetical protein